MFKMKRKKSKSRRPGRRFGLLWHRPAKTQKRTRVAKRSTYWKTWRRNRARSIRYARQQMAPYGLFLMVAGVSLMLMLLWASGIFDIARERFNDATAHFLADHGLGIDQVSVSGRKFTDKEELYEAVNVLPGKSLFHFDIVSARQRIEDLDWVDQASVTRLWPDSIHISLVERLPIAIWQLDGELRLVDRTGQVISSEHLTEFGNLPHVVGVGAAEAASDYLKLMSRHPFINSRVRAAIRVGARRWNLRLDSGVDVKLPDQGEHEALQLMTQLEEQHRILARDLSEIDLRVPGRLFLKLRSNKVVQMKSPGVET